MNENWMHNRFRGFNLTDMLYTERSAYHTKQTDEIFPEKDFKMISDWGFNFVRLPLSYRIWSSPDNPYLINEEKLKNLDKALEYANKYNLHTCICLHRIPGYCVNDDEPEKEPFNLWDDDEAKNAAKFQWGFLAERYKNISTEKLSFNIVNEPHYSVASIRAAGVTDLLVGVIRDVSPERTVMIDGISNGDTPPIDSMFFKRDNCIYSCRGYKPTNITHFGVDWMKCKTPPGWPDSGAFTIGDTEIKYGVREMEEYFAMWQSIANAMKTRVFCGEFGCFKKTPHDVMLKWLEDLMIILKKYDIGYALWNFKSPNFGLVNNSRTDAPMKNVNGYSVDIDVLNILQKY